MGNYGKDLKKSCGAAANGPPARPARDCTTQPRRDHGYRRRTQEAVQARSGEEPLAFSRRSQNPVTASKPVNEALVYSCETQSPSFEGEILC